MSPQEKMICDAIKSAIVTARPKRTYKSVALDLGRGYTYDRVNNIANGRTVPTEDDVSRIRGLLRLPRTWPYDTNRTDGLLPGQRVSLSGTPMAELPIAGVVAAGIGMWNVDVERNHALVPERLAQISDVGYILDGDSLMPVLQEGAATAYKRKRTPRTGYIHLIETQREGYKAKGLVYDRGDWYMASFNPRYPRELLPSGAIVHGILVGYYITRGTREIMELDPEGLRFDEPFA